MAQTYWIFWVILYFTGDRHVMWLDFQLSHDTAVDLSRIVLLIANGDDIQFD